MKFITRKISLNKDLKLKNINDMAHIALCADKNVIYSLGVAVYSLAKHLAMPGMFHLFINGTITDSDCKRLKVLSTQYSVPIVLYYVDNTIFKTLHFSDVISVTTYYRLIVPHVLGELGIQRVLYIDTDILCVRDISSMFQLDLGNKIAMVGLDYSLVPKNKVWWQTHCGDIGMAGLTYFNAGMMLIDIPKYIAENIGYRALALAQQRAYAYMDQDVLNILLEGKVLFDEKHEYNCTLSIPDERFPWDVKIVHFTGFKKPWKLYTSHWGKNISQNPKPQYGNTWKYGFYELWRQYAAASPWKNRPFDTPQNAHEWRWVSDMYRRNGQYGKALQTYGIYVKHKFGKN